MRLIKAALNGGLGDKPFFYKVLAETMKLCLGCKCCKRECENEVDMAMIKVEYLAQRFLEEPVPLRTRILVNLSKNLKHYTCLKPLISLRNRIPILRKATEKLLGISGERSIPEPKKISFTEKFRKIKQFLPATTSDSNPEVVLLIDTFTDNFSPANAEDAITVLNTDGYKVFIARPTASTEASFRPLCCGRTHIANGLVEEAKIEALRMISALLPYVNAGRTIICLEPACLLAIRDDYKFLGLGENATEVASHAILFEEFIAKEITAKRFPLELKPVDTGNQPVLIHGHCHQKAVGAMKSMRKVLKLIPELDFKMIDSTCCGMAGSFGIEREHAEMGMQMAELSLLPSLREHDSARIIANGFSCQHQIKEGVDRSEIHIATLLREALA